MHPGVRSALLGVFGLLLTVAGALLYETRQIRKLPDGNPEEFIKHGGRRPGQRVVVCAGASIVHGGVSVNFVDVLRSRFPADDYVFVNAGINGDLAYNVLQRLDSIIACDPDDVIILVGTNDVTSTLSRSTTWMAVKGKNLPHTPSIEWYRENMCAIVTQLQTKTRARIALASLPNLGEDISTLANQRIREFNATIRQVATSCGAVYLPVNECQSEYLRNLQSAPGLPYTGTPTLVVMAGIQHYLLGQSLDAISRRNGLVLSTDLIHMNSNGAAIIADQVEAFLRNAP